MANIKTKYLGLDINSPIIVSSSGISKDIDKIIKAAKYGAGAIVLKSLFEEQIKNEVNKAIADTTHDYPEVEDYIRNYSRQNSVNEYIQLIKTAKKELDIPVIASINCTSDEEWTSFAKEIENAGADAMELNIYILPNNIHLESREIEEKYFNIVKTIKEKITIPVAVKLGNHITNLPWFINQLKIRGADAITLFNRFYIPDINIENMEMVSGNPFSNESEIRESLRWTGLISGMIDIEISTSTGVHSGEGVIKQLLAGAQTVQVCSVLYKKGVQSIEGMIDDLQKWMTKNKYRNIEDFRGKLSYSNISDPLKYERAQYIKHVSSLE
ncbi:MAG: dihydroorotate dehydrogenase-like protein [Bacteroidales bacterium]|nr:dihydroorotate dehydrogenase-like protein [Bacteroidales bacterium]